jgi:hypothetical protein
LADLQALTGGFRARGTSRLWASLRGKIIATSFQCFHQGVSTMAQATVRLYHRQSDGKLVDAVHDMDISDFAGFLPSVGDLILQPGVPSHVDRYEPKNRNFWVVVQRVFNPRDNDDYVALIVEDRKPTPNEYDLLPSQ